MKKPNLLFVESIENLKIIKNHIFEKASALSINCSKCSNEDKKIFKEE